MTTRSNPKEGEWNHFWTSQNYKSIQKTSWSKKRIIKVIAPYLKSAKNVLDAGCGSGFFSKYFFDRNLNVTALDYSAKALAMTKIMTEGRVTLVEADLLSGNLKEKINNTFDLIFTDGLLEHFSEDEQDKIMQNFKSLLSGNGYLLTFVPNRFSPWELIRPFYMPGIAETPFVSGGLISLHKRNNLKIIESGGINTLPFRFSPDKIFGRYFGMLLYAVAKKT